MKPASTATAFGVASLGMAAFSTMDALMKGLSIEMGAYNALLWRTMAGALIGGAVFFARRSTWPGREAARIHLLRGVLSAGMAIRFFCGPSRVPLAPGVAPSFVPPLIATMLAPVLLQGKEERTAVFDSLARSDGEPLRLVGHR